jgi:hypothetical protein
MIKCEGMVTHHVKTKWESSNEDLLNSPPLQPGEVYGKVTYNEDLKALDGETVFVKDFGIDTGDAPNLNVMTSMGYKAGEIGALSYDEHVGMTHDDHCQSHRNKGRDTLPIRSTGGTSCKLRGGECRK